MMKKRKKLNKKKKYLRQTGTGLLLIAVLALPLRQAAQMKSGKLAFAFEEQFQEEMSDFMTETQRTEETETETGIETETWIEIETETETETGIKTEAETEIVEGCENGSEIETDTSTETDTMPETQSLSEPESMPETERVSEPESMSETERVSESESMPETERVSESESMPETERVSESESMPETERVSESESMPETEQVSEPEGMPETEWLSEPESMPETERVSQPESMPETENMSEGEIETETEGITETENDTECSPEDMPESEKEVPASEPLKIRRGRDYEITGDPNAWYRDDKDHLWIRAGSGVHIQTNERGGLSGGGSMDNLTQDGVISFTLRKTDGNGSTLLESEIKQELYYVDGEAPVADIQVNGSMVDGIRYVSDEMQAEIQIAPDGKSGLREAGYTILSCSPNGELRDHPEHAEWISCSTGQKLSVTDEGIFQIYVRCEDNVGNQAFSKSGVICLDKTEPKIIVNGVKDQTANSGKVKISVKSSDPNYQKGSLKAVISGVNEGKTAKILELQESEDEAHIQFLDIPQEKSYDDIYQLQVEASDKAGNRSEQTLKFSVNRFGSVYDIGEETREHLKNYYWNHAEDIIFHEMNIDYVGESRIFCRRDGVVTELKKQKDYQVSFHGNSNTWKQYRYTIPASYFNQEGIYEIVLSSNDRADNESDTGIQQKRVAFVLDWTAPDCFISGLEKEKIYQEKTVTIQLTPSDNHGIRVMRVYRNSELLFEKTKIPEKGESIPVILEAASEWQTLQIYLCDLAGNEYWSGEYPYYIHEMAENVPKYQRVLASARELAEGGSSSNNTGNSPAPGGSTKTRNKNTNEAVSQLQEREKGVILADRRFESLVILVIGGIMLTATGLSCFLSAKKKCDLK